MTDCDALELAILERVAASAPLSLEDLQQFFRHHSWNLLFAAVDQLSRKGSLAIRRIDRCTYHISLGLQFAPTGTGIEADNALTPPAAVQS